MDMGIEQLKLPSYKQLGTYFMFEAFRYEELSVNAGDTQTAALLKASANSCWGRVEVCFDRHFAGETPDHSVIGSSMAELALRQN